MFHHITAPTSPRSIAVATLGVTIVAGNLISLITSL